jgi:hypothetical protein
VDAVSFIIYGTEATIFVDLTNTSFKLVYPSAKSSDPENKAFIYKKQQQL